MDKDATTSAASTRPIRVGFALRKEKARKHVRGELVDEARSRGIEIVVIDEHVPLEEQGPFDVILQKIRRSEFEQELEAYKKRHPEVHLCDPPSATFLLRNRKSMLDVMPREGFALGLDEYRCTVPSHVVLEEGVAFEEAERQVVASELTYPFLAKSLWADGRAGSHDIAVVWSVEGLQRLCRDGDDCGKLPVLLEQYVDHGECLFKVYVLGNQQLIVTRPSLHLDLKRGVEEDIAQNGIDHTVSANHTESANHAEISEDADTLENSTSSTSQSLQHVDRVSAYPSSRSWGNASLAPPNHGVPTPPDDVWRGVARRLQERLGLSLFNFDLIVPRKGDKLIHLIDINYYPGIEKLPDSNEVVISFIESLVT